MAWYDTNWIVRQKITIDHTKLSANVVNFPVYLNLGLLGTTFFNNVGSAGADIRLTKSDGTTELAREIVSVGTATGEVHFNSSGTISSTQDTDFYIYYGNGTATDYAATATYGKNNTWKTEYKAIWHGDGTADSSSNGNNITAVNSPTIGTTGKVGNAFELTKASHQYFTLPNNTFSTVDPLSLIVTGKLQLIS